MRARNIKPGFFLNSELSEVDYATRLLFIGLWCYADREGRFAWKPKQIKAAIFPYDNVNIDKLLKSLLSLHVITCHDGVGYVEHFKKHQNPHPHEAKSILPEKPEINQCHDMSCNVTKCNADIIIPDTIIHDTSKDADKSATPQQLADLWNEIVEIPRVMSMPKKRITHSTARLRERGIADWKDIFQRIKKSSFLQGNNDRKWKADFDWIISNDANCCKVIEGKYDRGTNAHEQPALISEAHRLAYERLTND